MHLALLSVMVGAALARLTWPRQPGIHVALTPNAIIEHDISTDGGIPDVSSATMTMVASKKLALPSSIIKKHKLKQARLAPATTPTFSPKDIRGPRPPSPLHPANSPQPSEPTGANQVENDAAANSIDANANATNNNAPNKPHVDTAANANDNNDVANRPTTTISPNNHAANASATKPVAANPNDDPSKHQTVAPKPSVDIGKDNPDSINDLSDGEDARIATGKCTVEEQLKPQVQPSNVSKLVGWIKDKLGITAAVAFPTQAFIATYHAGQHRIDETSLHALKSEDVELHPQGLLVFLSEFLNRLHLNDWRLAALLTEMQRFMGSIELILDPPIEAMFEAGQAIDAASVALFRISALHFALSETFGRALASPFWTDSERERLGQLLRSPLADDALNYLHVVLLGPFDAHIASLSVAYALLVDRLTTALAAVDFEHWNSTAALNDPSSPSTTSQNVIRIFETGARIIASRLSVASEKQNEATSLEDFTSFLRRAWDAQASILSSAAPHEAVFASLVRLPFARQQADAVPYSEASTPEWAKNYAAFYRLLFQAIERGPEYVLGPNGDFKQLLCADNPDNRAYQADCAQFLRALIAPPTNLVDAEGVDAFAALSVDLLAPLLSLYKSQPEIVDAFVSVLRRRDVSWLVRLAMQEGGRAFPEARQYWTDSVASFSRIINALPTKL